jgi:hypothetical protein
MGLFNNFPTLGGAVFWTEVKSKNGWRLQQNDVTGHYRILDCHDWRQWSGSSYNTATCMFDTLTSGRCC